MPCKGLQYGSGGVLLNFETSRGHGRSQVWREQRAVLHRQQLGGDGSGPVRSGQVLELENVSREATELSGA